MWWGGVSLGFATEYTGTVGVWCIERDGIGPLGVPACKTWVADFPAYSEFGRGAEEMKEEEISVRIPVSSWTVSKG